MVKVMAIFGTRPEAIKMAPVVRELLKHPEIETKVCLTAQHREMLDQVVDLFQLPVDYDLDIMKQGQSLYDITDRVLLGLKEVLEKEKPDLVLVHGDTTTTFSATLAAFYQQIDVGHVEAGLRTGNMYSPFPEEANRRLTSVLTTLHFAPTETARQNLLKENQKDDHIFTVGNSVIDALLATVKKDYVFEDKELQDIEEHKRIILVTTHRRENLGEPMRNVYRALRRLVETVPDTEVVFPVHRNPLVRQAVKEVLDGVPGIHLVDPMEYEPFTNLMARSAIILTDSGGIQEEAPSLGKPVLVLRDTTERPEAVASGTVKLVGTDEDKVYNTAYKLLTDEKAYKEMAESINPYGDGHTSERIVQAILYFYGISEKKPSVFIAR
ncbi:non-hydrolyzing UDP-N-acetylglucosamine 2-epimerase [Allisonella histaminiformans]|uniref:non-hydrolyzing UDP-N-acetylglucosamine 2-epimerase n=1 Tax=Allisonella histaminiformans TaxID=209880 RepID=UPI00190EDB31|nr:UDP-N-acetylglucosamine 2-epimerase (non-hydrolyzing) [Allisonella histaminiformans]MCI6003567.1 UDP-N-acetylglucosamine 2-epimerase (non-hydrolyzing) [Allisonella histaminiformans]MDD6870152.1 UDP-N-acetylglucosamine 2-epimerase (non-hydrolyzing) [Allisonella histaminiformans]